VLGVGLGEILLIVLVTFLVAPKEIPAVLRKLGRFLGMLGTLRDDLMDAGRDVEGIARDAAQRDRRRGSDGNAARSRRAPGRRAPPPAGKTAARSRAPTRRGTHGSGGKRGR